MNCPYCTKEMQEEAGFTGLFHVSETDAMNCFREQRRIVEPKPVSNSCNRHSDCTAAIENWKRNHNGEAPGFNFHCHSEYCADCFGH